MKKNVRLLRNVFRNSLIFLLTVLSGCYSVPDKKNLEIEKDPAYPRWLKSAVYRTDQTSGIVFLRTDKRSGIKHFLLADDIGKIHHLIIKDDSLFSFSPVTLSSNVIDFLNPFPKWDFEEITYDRFTNSVYLSIEGNSPEPKKYTGIYKVVFSNNNIYSDTISDIKKINIQPEELFLRYTDNNIGYEGVGVDEKFFYLGLEGFQKGGLFADSTFLFIVDKKNLRIIKQINTKPLGIHTICGLYSDKNKSLYGIDRNMKRLFRFLLDDSLNIKDFRVTDIPSNIPGYPQFDYVAALESVTIDDAENIYCVDDPWKTFYIPSQNILDQLNNAAISNFKEYIPIIYKFKIK